jgi:hypothetical protein
LLDLRGGTYRARSLQRSVVKAKPPRRQNHVTCDHPGRDSPGIIGYPRLDFTITCDMRNGIMADHKHGEMDIEVQEKTFDGFMKWVTYSSVAIVVLLLFIALVNG